MAGNGSTQIGVAVGSDRWRVPNGARRAKALGGKTLGDRRKPAKAARPGSTVRGSGRQARERGQTPGFGPAASCKGLASRRPSLHKDPLHQGTMSVASGSPSTAKLQKLRGGSGGSRRWPFRDEGGSVGS